MARMPGPQRRRLRVVSQSQQDIRAKILLDYRRYLATRGFRSAVDFEPSDRLLNRQWDGVPGHVFIPEFMERHRQYNDHFVEIHEVAEDDIGICYKIEP